MTPQLIEGGNFSDHRGTLSYVNDFSFKDIERFYIISNSDAHPVRAWQGHKLDAKNFYCLSGSFRIHYVKIDNWENPSKDLTIETVTLTESESKMLHIPAGYANAIESLGPDSKLISFSTLPLSNVSEDDVRYDANYWMLNE
ncbi:MAG TPA: WxcM-like domain-containing protein [Flavobacterium sp.]|nr:WxcM-like domain-containing protein [Flavobacterium sp.]